MSDIRWYLGLNYDRKNENTSLENSSWFWWRIQFLINNISIEILWEQLYDNVWTQRLDYSLLRSL